MVCLGVGGGLSRGVSQFSENGRPPFRQYINTVNVRLIHTLLECILVDNVLLFFTRKHCHLAYCRTEHIIRFPRDLPI